MSAPPASAVAPVTTVRREMLRMISSLHLATALEQQIWCHSMGPKQQNDPEHDQHDADGFARGGGLLEGEARDRLREQHLDERKRAHARGGGNGEGEKPELRGERPHEAREQ